MQTCSTVPILKTIFCLHPHCKRYLSFPYHNKNSIKKKKVRKKKRERERKSVTKYKINPLTLRLGQCALPGQRPSPFFMPPHPLLQLHNVFLLSLSKDSSRAWVNWNLTRSCPHIPPGRDMLRASPSLRSNYDC